MESKWNLKDSRKVKEQCKICLSLDQTKNKFKEEFQDDGKRTRYGTKLKAAQVYVDGNSGHFECSSQETNRGTIQIRNARERNRVRAVNEAFARLRKAIPYTANRSKRVSKVKTLRKAVQYITELQMLLLNGCYMS